MSHVEKLLRLKDFSESFALTAAECIPDRKTGSGAAAGGAAGAPLGGKSLAAALALIPLLPPGESALDKMGASITAARAAFWGSVLALWIGA